MPPFEELDHTADWSFRASAPSREALFLEAADALYELGGVRTVPDPGASRTLHLEADDPESLLVSWLNELLYLAEHDRLALRELRIESLTDISLRVSGRPAEILAVGKHIKAATYSGLHITESAGAWLATVVLDV
ncbi:MAG: archease [Anaerolineales bacterium]|nr:archease [Anaerolineales bacterium]